MGKRKDTVPVPDEDITEDTQVATDGLELRLMFKNRPRRQQQHLQQTRVIQTMIKAEEKEITNVVSSWYIGIGCSSLGAQEAKFIASAREVNVGICICP